MTNGYHFDQDPLFVQSFHYAPIGMALISFDEKVIKANPSMCSILGYTVEEFQNCAFLEYSHPDDWEESFALRGELVEGKRDFYQIEKRYFHKNGNIIWVDLSVSLAKDTNGEPLYFIYQMKDISREKKIEKDLLETKKEYELITGNSVDIIIKLSLDLSLQFLSSSTFEVLGYQPKELFGLSILGGSHPEDRKALKHFYEEVKRKEAVPPISYRVKHKNGTFVWLESTAKAIRNAQGELKEILAFSRDITARIRAKEELRVTKDQLDYYIEHNVDPILIYDRNNKIIRTNQAFETTYQWKKEEILGKQLGELPAIPQEYIEESIEKAKLIKKGEIIDRYESVMIRKDNVPVHVGISGFLIEQDIGNWSVILRDLTESKQAEEMVIRSERLSAAGQLAAGIAHEIRNPMTAIIGFIQLMKEDKNVNYSYFDIILTEFRRIEKIVSELLLLAKPKTIETNLVEVRELVEEILILLETEANLNSIEVKTDFPGESVYLACDRNQIKQVCINFIKNAFEAMLEGGVLSIGIHKEAGGVRIQFKDTGEGIPEDILKKIGQPFFTTKEKGTGLGMMISKRIIEHHKGRLNISSSLQEGTSMDMFLPNHG